MLKREEVAQLMMLQSSAYELLMWLSEASGQDPQLLSPSAVALLHEPTTAAQWLEQNGERIPSHLLPSESAEPFLNLLCSFFSTSFHVRHVEFEDRLLDSRLTIGATEKPLSRIGVEQSQVLAVRHLASSEKIPLSDKDAHKLVKRKSLHEASILWAYVWELDRRARNKGKGPVVHRLWRNIPKETRRSLTADDVWAARAQILNAAQEYWNNQQLSPTDGSE